MTEVERRNLRKINLRPMPHHVFIRYSHDSEEHQQNVLNLADRLRDEGIDCIIDQYEESPSEGWVRWAINKIEEADFVLVVCTEQYSQLFAGKGETILVLQQFV